MGRGREWRGMEMGCGGRGWRAGGGGGLGWRWGREEGGVEDSFG